jgi:hypothetical protein
MKSLSPHSREVKSSKVASGEADSPSMLMGFCTAGAPWRAP